MAIFHPPPVPPVYTSVADQPYAGNHNLVQGAPPDVQIYPGIDYALKTDVIVGVRTPYYPVLQKKLAPALLVNPSFDNPPFSHSSRWAVNQPTNWTDGWSYSYTGLANGDQPYAGRQSTPRSVDRPPVIRQVPLPYLHWEPIPPLPTLSGRLNPQLLSGTANVFQAQNLVLELEGPIWPRDRRILNPALFAVTADNPPFSHPGRISVNQPTNWSDGWAYSYAGLASGDQPYSGRQGTPPSVDNPPARSVSAIASIVVRAWDPPPPAPPVGVKLTPPSVDSPPSLRLVIIPPQTEDFRLPQRSVQAVQPFVVAFTPNFRAFQGFPPVEDWRLPQAGEKLTPPSVDNPPTLRAIAQLTQADDWRYPQTSPKYVQQIVVTTDSPIGQRAFQGYSVDEWRLPQTSPKYVQPYTPDNPPFSQRTVTTIVVRTTWETPDPAATQGRKLTPPSVDNPPPSHIGRSVVTITRQMWEVDPPTPILGEKQTPPSVDNPPFIRALQSSYPADLWRMPQAGPKLTSAFTETPLRPTHYEAYISWLPLDSAAITVRNLNPSLLAVAVNDPPFTHWGRTAISVSVGFSWQPGDPQPIQRGPLNPSVLAVAVDNPPFTHQGRLERFTILGAWQPGPPLPTPSVRPTIPQGGVTPPPVTAEKFTVSGPTVESLFHPVGDISWNWGGGTQKRTV